MAKFIELSTVDENGSGTIFPAVIDKEEIFMVIALPGCVLKGASTAICVRSAGNKAVYTTATYADLKEILNV